ncbi:MAG: sulfurtransferase-like selenium metabolism protein YedF [Bacteroidales bacterium]|nr:sulfurtransferase-like selenium metabolism protein YedF [Bacteroidales bacterium]
MKILDVKGMKCPMPLIETKKALKEIEKNEALKVIIDNETSVKNVEHFLTDNGMDISKTEKNGIYEIVVNKQEGDLEDVQAEAYCSPSEKTDNSYVVMFAKDRLGEGSEELGNVLVGGFLNTLNEREVLPDKIIFINAGINLVLNDSPALPLLKDLADKKVDMVSCGTCLDYFGKMDELAVGRVSNMYEILESMLAVQKVINI